MGSQTQTGWQTNYVIVTEKPSLGSVDKVCIVLYCKFISKLTTYLLTDKQTQLEECIDWLIDWLTDLPTEWMTDRVINWSWGGGGTQSIHDGGSGIQWSFMLRTWAWNFTPKSNLASKFPTQKRIFWSTDRCKTCAGRCVNPPLPPWKNCIFSKT